MADTTHAGAGSFRSCCLVAAWRRSGPPRARAAVGRLGVRAGARRLDRHACACTSSRTPRSRWPAATPRCGPRLPHAEPVALHRSGQQPDHPDHPAGHRRHPAAGWRGAGRARAGCGTAGGRPGVGRRSGDEPAGRRRADAGRALGSHLRRWAPGWPTWPCCSSPPAILNLLPVPGVRRLRHPGALPAAAVHAAHRAHPAVDAAGGVRRAVRSRGVQLAVLPAAACSRRPADCRVAAPCSAARPCRSAGRIGSACFPVLAHSDRPLDDRVAPSRPRT